MATLPKRFVSPTDPNAYPKIFWDVIRARRAGLEGGANVDQFTYRWLRDQLSRLAEDQLDQPVLVFGPDKGQATAPAQLQPAYALGTVGDLFHVGGEVEKEVRGPDAEPVEVADHLTVRADRFTRKRLGRVFGRKEAHLVFSRCDLLEHLENVVEKMLKVGVGGRRAVRR